MRIHYAVIGICLLFLIHPWILNFFPQSNTTSERRVLAEFPSFSQNEFINGRYFRGITNYLEDHFPFRAHWIHWPSVFKYQIYSRFPEIAPIVNRRIIGARHWVFLEKSFQDLLPEREQRVLARNLTLIQRYFDSKSIRFLYFIAPDKNRIYPEFLPRHTKDFFVNYPYSLASFYKTAEKESLSHLNLHDKFWDIKSQLPNDTYLYYPAGDHFTSVGTLKVFLEIQKKINARFFLGEKFRKIPPHKNFHEQAFGAIGLRDPTDFLYPLPEVRLQEPYLPLPADLVKMKGLSLMGDSFLRACLLSLLTGLPTSELTAAKEKRIRDKMKGYHFVYGLKGRTNSLNEFLSQVGYPVAIMEMAERSLPDYYSRINNLARLDKISEIYDLTDKIPFKPSTACRENQLNALFTIHCRLPTPTDYNLIIRISLTDRPILASSLECSFENGKCELYKSKDNPHQAFFTVPAGYHEFEIKMTRAHYSSLRLEAGY